MNTLLAIALVAVGGYIIYRIIRSKEPVKTERVQLPPDVAPMRIDRTYSRPVDTRSIQPTQPQTPATPIQPLRPLGTPTVDRSYNGDRPTNAVAGSQPIYYNGTHYFPAVGGGYVNSRGFTVMDAVALGALGLVAYELLHERPAQAAPAAPAAPYGSFGDARPSYANPGPSFADAPVAAPQRSNDVDLSETTSTPASPWNSRSTPDVDLSESQPASVTPRFSSQPDADVSVVQPSAPVDVSEMVSARSVDVSRDDDDRVADVSVSDSYSSSDSSSDVSVE